MSLELSEPELTHYKVIFTAPNGRKSNYYPSAPCPLCAEQVHLDGPREHAHMEITCKDCNLFLYRKWVHVNWGHVDFAETLEEFCLRWDKLMKNEMVLAEEAIEGQLCNDETIRLRVCPFCGNPPLVNFLCDNIMQIQCNPCELIMKKPYCFYGDSMLTSEKELIERWNGRCKN